MIAPGAIQIETSAVDWTRDRENGPHSDTFLFADTLLKYGIGSDTEVRVSLTPYIHSRTRDASGASSVDGFGDVGLSFRHRLIDGGDGGISVAVQPTVVLPVGSDDVSTGTVSGSITLPIDIPVSGGWSLNATPTVAAAPDADGDGRHLAYAGVVAVSHGIGGNLSATGELFVLHDQRSRRALDPGYRGFPARVAAGRRLAVRRIELCRYQPGQPLISNCFSVSRADIKASFLAARATAYMDDLDYPLTAFHRRRVERYPEEPAINYSTTSAFERFPWSGDVPFCFPN